VALFYAKRQAIKDHCRDFVVLKVQIPDKGNILADDYFVQRYCPDGHDKLHLNGQRKELIEEGMADKGEFAYRGDISLDDISVFKLGKLAKNIEVPSWPMPKAFYLPISYFENLDGEYLTASKLDDYSPMGEENNQVIQHISKSKGKKFGIVLNAEWNWNAKCPDGMVLVFPEEMTVHDSLWISPIRQAFVERNRDAYKMVLDYLQGKPYGDKPEWHYVVPYIKSPIPSVDHVMAIQR
jgi:hypothetical protein